MPSLSLELIIVAAAILAAPLIVLPLRIAMPLVVVELVLGIMLGPQVLQLVEMNEQLDMVHEVGVAVLFLLIGAHIDVSTMRGPILKSSARAWGLSMLVLLMIGMVLAYSGITRSAAFITLPLLTTSLGAVMSVLRENDWIPSRVVDRGMVGGTVAEIGPIVLIALLLGSGSRFVVSELLIGIAVFVVVSLALIRTQRAARITSWIYSAHSSTTQVFHRVALLTLVVLVSLVGSFGIDIVLGAFAAGIVLRAVVATTQHEGQFLRELDVVGYGICIPAYFVLSGVALDLTTLVASWGNFVRLPLFFGLLVIARVVPAMWVFRRQIPRNEAAATGLLWSVTLPLVLASTHLAVDQGLMLEANAAALIGASVLGMLIFPPLSLRLLRTTQEVGSSSENGYETRDRNSVNHMNEEHA